MNEAELGCRQAAALDPKTLTAAQWAEITVRLWFEREQDARRRADHEDYLQRLTAEQRRDLERHRREHDDRRQRADNARVESLLRELEAQHERDLEAQRDRRAREHAS